MKNALKLLVPLAVVIIIAGGSWWGYKAFYKDKTEISFKTETVTLEDLTSSISASGTVEPEELINVGAQVSGKIMAFGKDSDGNPVDYRSYVKAGTLLAQIDDVLYKAALDEAEARQIQAESSIVSAKSVIASAEASVIAADVSIRQANADVTSAKASLASARAAQDSAEASVASAGVNVRKAQIAIASNEAAITSAKATRDSAAASLAASKTAVDSAKASIASAQASVASAEARIISAQAACDQSEAKFTLAKNDWERAQVLRRQKAMSDSDYDSYYAEFVSAKASIASAQAELANSKANRDSAAASLASARTGLDKSTADVAKAEAEIKRCEAEIIRAQSNLDNAKAEVDRTMADKKRSEAELANAKAAVARANAALENSLAGVAKAQADKKRAEAALAGAHSDLKYSEAQLKITAAELIKARRNLDYCAITAPVDGIIIDRRVSLGQTVVSSMSASSIFLIAKDLKKMEVWVSVNEADISHIRPDMAAEFTIDTFPGMVFEGKVKKVRLNATMSQNVVTYIVEVTTDNSDGKLIPYLTANVKFIRERRKNVLTVSNAALRFKPDAKLIVPEFRDKQFDEKARIVYVAEGELLRPVEVKTGLNAGGRVELIDPPFKEGDVIVYGATEISAAKGKGAGDKRSPFMPKPENNKVRGGGSAANRARAQGK